jgi:hypothetical protein
MSIPFDISIPYITSIGTPFTARRDFPFGPVTRWTQTITSCAVTVHSSSNERSGLWHSTLTVRGFSPQRKA